MSDLENKTNGDLQMKFYNNCVGSEEHIDHDLREEIIEEMESRDYELVQLTPQHNPTWIYHGTF